VSSRWKADITARPKSSISSRVTGRSSMRLSYQAVQPRRT
jgi:hypothetical protein